MFKRGLSAIIETVLIILLALAAVGLIWQFLLPVFTKSGTGIDLKTRCFEAEAEPVKCEVFTSTDSAEVTIRMKKGDASGLIAVLEFNDSSIGSSQFNNSVSFLLAEELSFSLGGKTPVRARAAAVVQNDEGTAREICPLSSEFVECSASVCTSDNDCDDGLFCNGNEICASGTCQPEISACPGETCYEPTDSCVLELNSCSSSGWQSNKIYHISMPLISNVNTCIDISGTTNVTIDCLGNLSNFIKANFSGPGIWVGSSGTVNNLTIQNCAITGVLRGITVSGGDNILIRNNQITAVSPTGHAVRLLIGATGTVIINNTMNSTNHGISIVDSIGTKIINNTLCAGSGNGQNIQIDSSDPQTGTAGFNGNTCTSCNHPSANPISNICSPIGRCQNQCS